MAIEPMVNGVPMTPEVTYTLTADHAGPVADRASANAFNTPEDISASSLDQLLAADLTRLSAILQPSANSALVAQVASLIREASDAIAQGNTLQAVDSLRQIAALEPQTFEILRGDAAFASIRPEIDQLLSGLTSAARFDAQASLGRAEQLLDASQLKTGFGVPSLAQVLIKAANRFFDAGGYVNFVRSADLAQTIIENYSAWLPNYGEVRPDNGEPARKEGLLTKRALRANVQSSRNEVRMCAPKKMKTLWLPAPLMLLVLAWLVLGVVVDATTILACGWSPNSVLKSVTDVFCALWGLGFLTLIGLAFYARVRHSRY